MNECLIYDIGMHVGQDTAYYLQQGYRVVAVEANPLLASQGRVRFREAVDAGRLVIENAGIADEAQAADFWICEDKSEWSSFDREVASRRGYGHHAVSVNCVRLSDLIRKHGHPHFIKIGVKGSNETCLRHLTVDLAPEYISVESYGEQTVRDLAALGYRRFKVIDQICFRAPDSPAYRWYWALKGYHDASLYRRTAYGARLTGKLGGRWLAQALLRRYRTLGGHDFEDGSSGPFGEATPGRWTTGDEAAAAIRRFDEWHRSTGEAPEKRWFDIHAKK